MRNQIVLALGSNTQAEQWVPWACCRLKEIFPDIRISEAVYTKAVDWISDAPFLNCVAVATTDLLEITVRDRIKQLEKDAGRTPAGKQQGLIPLDLDLLQWNQTIYKPNDWNRADIKEALASLFPTDK